MFVTWHREPLTKGQDVVTIQPEDGSMLPERECIPSCVPDAVLDQVVAFSAAKINGRYQNMNSDLVAKCLADCYGPHGQFPRGDMLRVSRPPRRRTDRDRIADMLTETVCATTPDWCLAWAVVRVVERANDAVGSADIFGGDIKIDLDLIWGRVANEVEARLAAVGMTPAVVDDAELGTPATA